MIWRHINRIICWRKTRKILIVFFGIFFGGLGNFHFLIELFLVKHITSVNKHRHLVNTITFVMKILLVNRLNVNTLEPSSQINISVISKHLRHFRE